MSLPSVGLHDDDDDAESAIRTIVDTLAQFRTLDALDTEKGINDAIPLVHQLYRVIAQTTLDPATEQQVGATNLGGRRSNKKNRLRKTAASKQLYQNFDRFSPM
jgi:hypothetical protein